MPYSVSTPNIRRSTHPSYAPPRPVSWEAHPRVEHGKITEVDAIRGYVEALGGSGSSCASARRTTPARSSCWAGRIVTWPAPSRGLMIGVAGRRAHVRLAERRDQGGNLLKLIALGVEIQGAEAHHDVTRSGRDVAVEALHDALRGAGDDRLDPLQFLQRHAVVGDGIVAEHPASALEAAVDSHGHEQRGGDVVWTSTRRDRSGPPVRAGRGRVWPDDS